MVQKVNELKKETSDTTECKPLSENNIKSARSQGKEFALFCLNEIKLN